MPTEDQRKLVSYSEARPQIADGDLLLFRRRGMISVAGRGVHSHAAKAAWWGDDLFCLEIREWYGGRAVTLSSQVTRYPERIDVYEVNPDNRWPEYDVAAASRYMRRLAGCPYGYLGVVTAATLHLPFLRFFSCPNLDDSDPGRRPPFCSQACAMADRLGGGVDPVPHLADPLTEPADLARSPFYRYRFTLTQGASTNTLTRSASEDCKLPTPLGAEVPATSTRRATSRSASENSNPSITK